MSGPERGSGRDAGPGADPGADASRTTSPETLLGRLGATLDARRGADPASSYAASLFARGDDVMLRKIGEEAVELLLAGKDGDDAQIVAETADLWFHTLVFLSYRGLGPDDILTELARREGVSGHVEKAARAVTSGEQNP